MNHQYLMSGFPKPRGDELTLLALEYGCPRTWWRGERLPWLGDARLDRRITRKLTHEIFGEHMDAPTPAPLRWWIWLVLVLGLAAWAVPVYLIGMGSRYERIRVCTYTCAHGWDACPETESCEWMTRERLLDGTYRWLTTSPKTVDTTH